MTGRRFLRAVPAREPERQEIDLEVRIMLAEDEPAW
jgi:hypothetical protein